LKKTNRKDFLKITGLMAGGLFFNKSFAEGDNNIVLAPDDYAQNFELNKNVLFFNNGTIGPSPKVVSTAIKNRIDFVNQTGKYSGLEHVLEESVARFLNIKTTEIAFTHNVTEGVNIAAAGIGLQAGDEVIMTGHEHVGGALPWLNKQKVDGIVVKAMKLGNTVQENMDNLVQAITSKTKIIAIPHVPCTIGTLLPLKMICKEAKKRGILTFIDGAHPLGMMPLDLKDLGCDIYASCFHKWMCGPKGAGFLYISEEIMERINPVFVGAYSADWELKGRKMELIEYTHTAHRYYYGTQNSAHYAGIIEAVKFQETIGRQTIFDYGQGLSQYFKKFILDNKQRFELLSPIEKESSSNMVSFKVKKGSLPLVNHLRSKEIITRYVAESDLDCMRVSFHLYNNQAQVSRLIKEIELFH